MKKVGYQLSSSASRRQVLGGIAASLLVPGYLGASASVAAAEDDLRFVHAYGETVLTKPAQRVVSLGYTCQDPLLALGVAPVAVRKWFGDMPFGVWPWAEPMLGDAKPVLIEGEVSIEIVASLAPDLIVAIGSGISRAEYDVLSQIAPVLMHTQEKQTYGTQWDEMTRTIGRAVGKTARAEELIAATRQKFTDARARHPQWANDTAVCGYNFGGETGAFIGTDTRQSFLNELGFKTPEKLIGMRSSGEFYGRLSPEDLSPLDADLLIWISSFDTVPDIVALPMRKTLKVHSEGREVLAGSLIAGALSFGSVLSLPYALDALEPEIELALDGNPQTPVPSAVKAGLAP